MNRLAREMSPYLLQHSENPVDWYPWCKEAFEKARREDKPVFLSIGYSTCHWCHVMAHESFEDEETAQLLNDSFICIKVDREERPDIDAVYMNICQAATGSGGWPMTVFMTPDAKPFFVGTYFPKHGRYGRPGLTELAREASRMWKEDRAALLESCERLVRAASQEENEGAEPDRELLDRAFSALRARFDPKWGGFGRAPKFPAAHNLLFLMQYGDIDMSVRTLTAMAKGGIFDQIGGGFARYSTDEKWLVPHFEKMLYDNALLIIAYTEAYERTHNDAFRNTAQRTADYIVRELRSPDGAYFSAQDADSGGVEGGSYTFTPGEVRSVLGESEGREFCRVYGITEESGIPNLIESGAPAWDEARLSRLYEYRRSRSQPGIDDKILLSWNAWTAAAFARCGRLREAEEICSFISSHMTDASGRLFLRIRGGEAANAGQLDDYAVFALALLTLYRATLDVSYLEQAILRAGQMLDFFEDEKGGFFLTAYDAEKLIERPKEVYDGAMPSGNSVAAMVLELLARHTAELKWREAADRQMRFIAGSAAKYPAGQCFALLAADMAISPGRELIVCGRELPKELTELHDVTLSVIFKSPENAERLAVCAPFTAAYPIPDSGTLGYLCENGVCRAADSDVYRLSMPRK